MGPRGQEPARSGPRWWSTQMTATMFTAVALKRSAQILKVTQLRMNTQATLLTIGFALFPIAAPCEDAETQLYKDPISGEETVFEKRLIDGWDIYVTPGYSTQGKGILIVAEDGVPIVMISAVKDGPREISISDRTAALPVATLQDRDGNGAFDSIRYSGKSFEAQDTDFNGQPEMIINYDSGRAQIWHNDAWYSLAGEGTDKYIVVSGERIYMQYRDGKFVPVQEQ